MLFKQTAKLQTAKGLHLLQLKLARGFWSRFRGLMMSRPLKSEPHTQGLLITRCPSVHGFFMLYRLDIVYLAAAAETTGAAKTKHRQAYEVTHTTGLRPWSVSFGKDRIVTGQHGAIAQRSAHVLELPSGAIDLLGIAPGDRLEVLS
jgi:uncharacterized membrane protein (UPF0127 family)